MANEHGGVADPVHVRNLQTREPGDPFGFLFERSTTIAAQERTVNVSDGNAVMNAERKSDESVVPLTSANNDATEASAESIEERDSARRNTDTTASDRTQDRTSPSRSSLDSVREAARRDPQLCMTSLLHHVSEEALLEAFYDLKKHAAVGVDEVTWHEYEQSLEDRIVDLHDRIHRGGYRPKPSLRVWIPKADGGKRPLGIAALEDKIVQQAVLWVLNCIYEQDFVNFSYGFRRFRCQHDALDALTTALVTKRVNYVLDADIQGFFDAIDHDRLLEFLSRRIGDRRILRLIRKWLKAGIMEDGEWSETSTGSPQGSVISPLLSNVYLHYVLDQWVQWWRQTHACGDVIIVRYADDFVMGFQHQADAEAFLAALRIRFAEHGLTLHPEKTRLLEFGRFASSNRRRRNEGKPETFDFPGFTHVCGRTKRGRFIVWRLSIRKRLAATLHKVKTLLRKRLNWSLGDVGRWLRSVATGWLRYHAVPGNSVRIRRFLHSLSRLWLRSLRRRSQRGSRGWTWDRMRGIVNRYLPKPRILHPYPEARLHAKLKAGAV